MASKYRILTYYHLTNNGAFLFSYSLQELLTEALYENDVQIVSFKSPRLTFVERLKVLKPLRQIPDFYLARARLFQKEIKEYLKIDQVSKWKTNRQLQKEFARKYDALIVAMDVWCISNDYQRPPFPNIYWLMEPTDIPKIAFSISAYKSDRMLIEKHKKKITSALNGFEIIGTRDQFTFELVQQNRTRQDGIVRKIPDPTFMYQIKNLDLKDKLVAFGVDFSRPLLGILLFGNDQLSSNIRQYYRARGYQILALSMFNQYADINLGHLLTPIEWAEVFRYLTFCISDRFHGTIFSLLNGVPVVCVEKDFNLTLQQSKLYDLLHSFQLDEHYFNLSSTELGITDFLDKADALRKNWNQSINRANQTIIDEKKQKILQFLNLIKDAN